MKLFESMVNLKINRISVHELVQYAQQHGMTLTKAEAEEIVKLLKGKQVDIFNQNQRKGLLTDIAKVTTKAKAAQMDAIFVSLTGK